MTIVSLLSPYRISYNTLSGTACLRSVGSAPPGSPDKCDIPPIASIFCFSVLEIEPGTSVVPDSCPFLSHITTRAGDSSPTLAGFDHLLGLTFLCCEVILVSHPIFYPKPHLFAGDREGRRAELPWIPALSLRSLGSVWCPPTWLGILGSAAP